MVAVDVSPARKSDIRAVSAALARAFQDDPVMTWMLPDAALRAKRLPRLFAVLMRHHSLAGGGAVVARDRSVVAAASLWDPPGRWKHSRWENLRSLPALLVAFGPRLSRGNQAVERIRRVHPAEPHWYLAVIGSDPTVRGMGFGAALMRSRLDRCDAEHAPAYLESSNPDNVPYYLRFGFEVSGEITLPDGGPTLWPMWRQPR